jgi:hypothetical protein
MQGRLVEEAAVLAYDNHPREIAVMKDQAGWGCRGGKTKRHSDAKRLPRSERIGKGVARRCGAGAVSGAVLVFQFGTGVTGALANAPGDAAYLDEGDPGAPATIVSAGRSGRVERWLDTDGRDAPIVEAAPFPRGVEAARKR